MMKRNIKELRQLFFHHYSDRRIQYEHSKSDHLMIPGISAMSGEISSPSSDRQEENNDVINWGGGGLINANKHCSVQKRKQSKLL